MLALMIIYRCLASSLMVYMGVTVVDLKTLTDRWGKEIVSYSEMQCQPGERKISYFGMQCQHGR